MPRVAKRPLHPNLLLLLSVPHFIFAGLLAALNWNRLGFPQKARNTVKWSIIGTIAIIIIASYLSKDVIIKMWPVWLGVNVGTGMALRTIQLPAYQEASLNSK